MSALARRLAVVVLTFVLGACAHPIVIGPDLNAIPGQAPTVSKTAALVITVEDRDREVTTPGGGGDSIRYFPYKELEAGIFKVLSSIYAKVTLLRSLGDRAAVAAGDVSYVFVPKIATDSSSSSMFTWPPTNFLITIQYEVQDASGKRVYANQVLGRGQAEYEEFSKDFGLAGKRAAQDVLQKLREQVEKASELK